MNKRRDKDTEHTFIVRGLWTPSTLPIGVYMYYLEWQFIFVKRILCDYLVAEQLCGSRSKICISHNLWNTPLKIKIRRTRGLRRKIFPCYGIWGCFLCFSQECKCWEARSSNAPWTGGERWLLTLFQI